MNVATGGTDATSASEHQGLIFAATTPSRCTASELAGNIKTNDNNWIVVDVRDDDFIGGNIVGAIRRSVNMFEDDDDIDEFVRNVLAREPAPERVVFHCMLSQQRGPFAARRFLARLSVAVAETEEEEQGEQEGGLARAAAAGGGGGGAAAAAGGRGGGGGEVPTSTTQQQSLQRRRRRGKTMLVAPQVSILNGGFSRFQSLFSEDSKLVENYEERYHRQW